MCILECDALPFIIYSHYKRMHHCFVDIYKKNNTFCLTFGLTEMQFKLMFTQKANDFYMVVYCVSETSFLKCHLQTASSWPTKNS